LVTEGLDLKAWNRIASILDGLASDWPGVANELGWITTKHPLWEENPRGAIGAADSVFGEKIAFNPYYLASPRRIAKTVALGEGVGLYPGGAKKAGECYFVTHEWGHLVNAWLRRHDLERWLRLMALFRTGPGATPSAFDPARAAPISEYATSRIADAFAESFSVLQWQQPEFWPDLIQRFGQLLWG
jgi:hypothetical protein